MGACFTVNLELTFLDEAAAVKAMQEYIHTANADFGLEKHKKRSVGTDKSEDLIKICFSSCDGGYTNLNRDGNKILFISDLDTCYSWKTVIPPRTTGVGRGFPTFRAGSSIIYRSSLNLVPLSAERETTSRPTVDRCGGIAATDRNFCLFRDTRSLTDSGSY